MPDRFLREGWLRSEKLQGLECEVRDFYMRLLSIVDDFGCYDGREAMIVNAAYPTRGIDELIDIDRMLGKLHLRELIVRYSNAGRPYIALTQWRCGIRARRLFPAPPVDVDLYDGSEATLRGPYGRPIIWNNPAGSDSVSILLDLAGRATVPQPAEWRPPSHCIPVPRPKGHWSAGTGQQSLSSSAQPNPVVTVDPLMVKEVVVVTQKVSEAVAEAVLPQSLPTSATSPPSPPPQNGESYNGETRWTGAGIETAEALRLRWQAMFPALVVPDELDHAGEWLRTHDGERGAILDQNGLEAYLFRWLKKSHNALTAKG
jgi:hypothetical protein